MHFVFLVLLGLSINGYNAAEAGRPVESLDDLQAAVVQSYDNRSKEHGQAWYSAAVND